MKMLLLTDIHHGTSRESTTHPGIIRQANSEAHETFQNLIPHFQSLRPDVVINLGDTIRDTPDPTTNEQLLRDVLHLFNKLQLPTIHLLGNHEIEALPKNTIDTVFHESGYTPTFFGYKQTEQFQLLWLDLALNQEHRAFIPKNTLQWLKKQSLNEKPVILLSHHPLTQTDTTDNFYFNNKDHQAPALNAKDVLNHLPPKLPLLSLNAHTHQLSYHSTENKTFITLPAFSENIAAEKYPQNNPGIYSMLQVTPNRFIVKSYSGKFCFATIDVTFEPKNANS